MVRACVGLLYGAAGRDILISTRRQRRTTLEKRTGNVGFTCNAREGPSKDGCDAQYF